MSEARPAAVLGHVEAARRRTRVEMRGLWFPLLVFGGLLIGGAVVGLAVSGLAVAVYWAVAGPSGAFATAVFFGRRGRRRGVEPRAGAPAAVAAALIAACFLGYEAALAVDATLAAATPFLAISGAYVVFAHREERHRFGGLVLMLGASSFALGVSALAPITVTAVLSVAYGVTFLLYGLTYRAEEKPARR